MSPNEGGKIDISMTMRPSSHEHTLLFHLFNFSLIVFISSLDVYTQEFCKYFFHFIVEYFVLSLVILKMTFLNFSF